MTKSVDSLELAADLLRSGVAVRFEARGWSMFPSIHDGDRLLLEPLEEEVRPGDVLFFRSRQGRYLCHRFLRRSRPGFLLTKGDALVASDDPVTAADCLGRLRAADRNGRNVPILDRGRFWARAIAIGFALGSRLLGELHRPVRDLRHWRLNRGGGRS